jgi:hypothetical protein
VPHFWPIAPEMGFFVADEFERDLPTHRDSRTIKTDVANDDT